jgi:hypothetical protein
VHESSAYRRESQAARWTSRNRKISLLTRFKALSEDGRIEVVTFHQ